MNVLVTGGAGYIGSALVNRLLCDGKQVTVADSLIFSGAHALHGCFTNDLFSFVRRDVRDVNLDDFGHLDAVVNLAAYSLPLSDQYPDEAMAVNRDAAVALGEQCAKKGVHYIFASTCSNYGVKTDGFAIETDILYPSGVYAKSKVAAEQIISKNKATAVLRFATAYGLSAMFRPDLILHGFIRDALLKGEIRLYGTGNYRPLCHVDDLSFSVKRVLESGHYGIYNIGNTRDNYTKAALAVLVQEKTHCEIVDVGGNVDDPRNYRVSFEKAANKIGFYTSHKIDDEIEKIVDAYEQGLLTFEAPKFEQPTRQEK